MFGSALSGLVASVVGNQTAMDTASAFFGPLAFILAAGRIAPSRRNQTVLILAGLVVVVALLSLVLATWMSVEEFNVLIPLAQCLAALCAVFLRHEKSSGILAGLFGVLILGLQLGGPALHFWTVVVALQNSGLLAGFITFMLPVISTAYWFFRIWNLTGTVANTYCTAVLAYLGVAVVGAVGVVLASRDDTTSPPPSQS